MDKYIIVCRQGYSFSECCENMEAHVNERMKEGYELYGEMKIKIHQDFAWRDTDVIKMIVTMTREMVLKDDKSKEKEKH